MCVNVTLSHCMVQLSLECFARELIVTEPHTLDSFCGRLVARVCVALWQKDVVERVGCSGCRGLNKFELSEETLV